MPTRLKFVCPLVLLVFVLFCVYLVFIGHPWRVPVCMRVSVLCRLYYPPPRLTAEVRGCCSWTSQRRISWHEVRLRPEREKRQSPSSHHMLSVRGTAGGNRRHIDIWYRNWLKNLACFWFHPSAWDMKLLASQSHLLKSLKLASCLKRVVCVGKTLGRANKPEYSQTDESALSN